MQKKWRDLLVEFAVTAVLLSLLNYFFRYSRYDEAKRLTMSIGIGTAVALAVTFLTPPIKNWVKTQIRRKRQAQ